MPSKSHANAVCAYKGCFKTSEVALSLPLGISMRFCRDCAHKLLGLTLVSEVTESEALENLNELFLYKISEDGV
jgi:hypothetical protein